MQTTLERIYDKEIDGQKVRSREKWAEKGEENSRYFLGLEKLNAVRKHITQLNSENGNVIKDLNELLQEQKQFYEICTHLIKLTPIK